MSSAVECFEVGAEGVVGLAGDVAFVAAEDLASVETFGFTPCCVGLGVLAVGQSADGDHLEGAVGLSVAAVVEVVARGAAAAGLDRGGAAELGEGGFAAEPLDVLVVGDEELACVLGADSEEGDCAWCGGADEPVELLVELDGLIVECADSTSEASEREPAGLGRLVQAAHVGGQVQTERGSGPHRAAAAELATQLLGRGDQKVVEPSP